MKSPYSPERKAGNIPSGTRFPFFRQKETAVYILCLVSVFFFIGLKLAERVAGQAGVTAEMLEASRIMERAVGAVRGCREEKGLLVDRAADPNRTGLIGIEFSPITTSLGNLGAKRTTTNPSFAALIVHLLEKAGAEKGDAVAIGASSSFPSLIIASLSAAKALGLRPVVICSLGASNWGANDPEFQWLEMQECLRGAGVFDVKPVALSLGGAGDAGKDMSPEGRDLLEQAILESGTGLFIEADLERNVRERMRLYEAGAAGRRISAFINIGGGWANMGTDSEILKVEPGLAVFRKIPEAGKRGVVFEMARRGVPVIHLLNIKGLCERYGLPWDPVPLPNAEEGRVADLSSDKTATVLLQAVYFLVVGFVLFLTRKSRS